MVWGGADVLRRVVEAAKWPFERAIWTVERGLVWPLEERTGDLSAPVRAFAVAALAVLAVGAGALGLVLGSSGGDGSTDLSASKAPAVAPIVQQAPTVEADPAAPVLQGARPDFTAESGSGASNGSAEVATSAAADASANSTSEVASSGPTSSGSSSGTAATEVTGPAAIEVARQFAGAFVLYEIGGETAKVRDVFRETATPQLTRSLLQRPPRQPAGVEVPKAKVLNVVPGPHHGDTYTLSVSLLRVGVTSELRLEMQRDAKTKEWRVGGTLG
ncbi:MAG TPA: hypothetical protein VFT10_04850 [Solirubrobacterales bacterium]|nr:hypothetical protein [Solirubrobacterales bacterium]